MEFSGVKLFIQKQGVVQLFRKIIRMGRKTKTLKKLQHRVLRGFIEQPESDRRAADHRHPDGDRLSVRKAVSAAAFHRMAEGVTEIQEPASAAVLFIVRHNVGFHTHADLNDILHRPAALIQCVEQIGITEKRILDHFGITGAQFAFRQRRKRIGITKDQGGLVKRTDLVLGSGEIDRRFPAYRGIHRRQKCRRHLHTGDSPLVGCRGKTGQVPRHAPAEGDQAVASGKLRFGESVHQFPVAGEALCILPRREHNRFGLQPGSPQAVQGGFSVKREDVLTGYQDTAARAGPLRNRRAEGAEQAGPDPHFINGGRSLYRYAFHRPSTSSLMRLPSSSSSVSICLSSASIARR